MANSKRRPSDHCYRPPGLAIAIIGSGVIYGLYPAIPLALIIWSQAGQRLIGVDFVGGTIGAIGVLLGLLVVCACVLAWIGRPRQIRSLLIGLLWLSTALQLYRQYGSATVNTLENGIVGGNITVPTSVSVLQTVLLIVIPLYATWYMNRAPARQFYACRNP